MGVQGSGESTVGNLLAQRLGVPLIDGDSLHSVAKEEPMASGQALSDAERLPWLHEVGERLALGSGPAASWRAQRSSADAATCFASTLPPCSPSSPTVTWT